MIVGRRAVPGWVLEAVVASGQVLVSPRASRHTAVRLVTTSLALGELVPRVAMWDKRALLGHHAAHFRPASWTFFHMYHWGLCVVVGVVTMV